MITDARVLQPTFVPRDVKHRDHEIGLLSSGLDPITRMGTPEPALLFGPSGTGKTCIARYTVDNLRESMIDIAHTYVNCWQNYSRFRMLYRILEGIGRTHDVHRQSTPADVLLERIQSYDDRPYVVILDEVDQLEDLGVLYQLYRISNLSMILIANREEEFFFQLDQRIRSRFQSSTRIQFDRYSLDQLVSILSDRVRWGLTAGAVETLTLEKIADAAAGDARIALGILRVAAQKADGDGFERITPEHVDASVPVAKKDIRRKSVEQLTADQRVLFEIISERGTVEPGVLYREYCQRVDEPKTKRTIRNYLSKMQRYKLIVAEGENRGRKYRLQR